MKILIVSSKRDYLEDGIAVFIKEQVDSLCVYGHNFEYFLISKKGVKGYLFEFFRLKDKIKEFKPDIIHAHYGLSGLLANIQRKVPVITTYHGSDINDRSNRKFSQIAIYLSKWNIFVSNKQLAEVKFNPNKTSVIPCGVATDVFYPKNKKECRKLLNLEESKIYILFSKAFNVKVKNYPLAKSAVDKIKDAELLELHGYTREQVNLLMNACDVALLTSFSEGSPQFIKEAMATNTPIVSTDVGDVREAMDGADNCYICSYELDDVVEKLNLAILTEQTKSNLREKIEHKYSLKVVAKQIQEIYERNYNG